MNKLYLDFRLALLSLPRRPVYSMVAVLCFAIGIGASTGIFALINGVMLRSLPVPRAEELHNITWVNAPQDFKFYSGNMVAETTTTAHGNAFSFQIFEMLSKSVNNQGKVFAFASIDNVKAQVGPDPFFANGMMVSSGFFRGLEVEPILGRTFEPGWTSEINGPSVLISETIWRQHFGADPGVVGRSLSLNGVPHLVLGVLPGRFKGVEPGAFISFYTLLSFRQSILPNVSLQDPGCWVLNLMARINPRSKNVIGPLLTDAFRQVVSNPLGAAPGIKIEDGRRGLMAESQEHEKPLLLMFGGGGILLLVTCINLAGLTITRASERQFEQGVRLALGASKIDLARPILVESLLLAIAGGASGIVLAPVVRDVLSGLLSGSPDGLSYDISIQPRAAYYPYLSPGKQLSLLCPSLRGGGSPLGCC